MYIQKVKNMMISSLKEKNKEKASTLRLLLAKLEKVQISDGVITETSFIASVKSEIKSCKEQIEYLEKDSLEYLKVAQSIKDLTALIGEELSGEALKEKVFQILSEISEKEQVSKKHMGVIKKKLPTADMKEVSTYLNEFIQK